MNSQAKKKFFSGLFGSLPSSLLCLFVLPMSAWAQVTFEQKSDPAGLFTSTSATKNLNDVVSTMTPSLSTGGYSFTHWTVNGVRENAPDGQAKNKVSVTLTENTVAIAHYRLDTNDSDSDGVPDWYEVRMFGNLDRNASYDGDGDGLSLADERKYGLAATIADEFTEGGASIRRSGQVFANFGGAKKLSVSSDPAGLLTSSETFPETNSSYTSPNKNGLTSGYYFSHWEVNGVRQADTSGIGLSQISFTMTEDKTVVAKYYAENADTDSDGLPDWYEWREFGSLDNNGTSDPDGDGFSMDAERQFGLSAVIGDEIMEGGASIRRSGQVFANFGGAKKLSVSSDPAGLLTSSETFPETNSSYTSPNKNGLTSGYYFSHWEVNGVRQADTSGIGLSQISFTMTEDKTVVAKYYAENADTDSDGLPDWYEWREFGNLDNNGTSDPDGDGFSMDTERQFGLSAVIGDEIMEGGGSIRRSGTFGYIEFQPNEDDDGDGLTKAQELHYGTSDDNADSDGDGFPDGAEVSAGSDPADADSVPNRPPRDLNSTAVLAFSENQPLGTIIGEFNATDPDGDAITYHFVSGENNNSLFNLDTNGTLKTATTFDYESNASIYTITVQAKDELNATTEGNFTVTLLDVYEPSRQNHTVELNATVGLEMIWVEPGTFMMGSPTSEVGRSNNEGLKSKNIPRGFFLGKYELTQAQYEAVMKGNTFGLSPNPSLRPNKPNFPVEKVSSNHTQTFLEVLNKKQKNSGSLTYRWKYVLPTEAQWEYACRAGTTTAFSWGDSINSQHANYNDNIGRPVNVGQYEPNHWGFYDMHGNIYEWVSDRLISASKASARGGSYQTNYSYTRSAHRSAHMPNLRSERIGIRLAYEYIPNRNPSNLSSSHALAFNENLILGTIIGEFNATDPDGDAMTYHFVNGENNNSLFTLDTNGTLKTATTFDYESNASSYTITVQAKDELNATTEGNFTVTLLNVNEPPVSQNLGNTLYLLENQPVGTVISDLNFSDPEGDSNVSFSLIHPLPSDLNLTLWLDASEPSTITETNGAISTWSDKSGKGNHATQTTILKQPIFDDANQSVIFDGANDHLSVSGFNPSGSMSIYAIFANTREVLPSSGHVVDVLFTVTGGGGPGWSIESFNTYGVRTDRKIYLYQKGESATWFLNGNQGMNSHTIGLNEYVLLSAILPNASADLGPLRIGTFRNSTYFGKNTFKEIIFSDTAHSEEQRIGVEGYLSHKWGLAEKLPITHPSRIFSIDANGTLSTNRSFDYESNQSTHTVRISAKDDGGAVTEGNYTVSLLNINEPPHDLNSTAALNIAENQPISTVIGEFNATDPDGDAIIYHFVNGENNNSLFTLDTNGTLKTATTFDYETNDSSYTITVQAKDELNATTEGNFTVTLTNMVEDNDEDGTEDHYDPDDDNDGFSDADELAYGSDPKDKKSLANSAPDLLELNGTTILENQPKGTIIGRLIGRDPDSNSTLVYSQIFLDDQSALPVHVEANGVVRSTRVFDYETNDHNYTLRVRLADEHNFSLEKTFTVKLLDQNEAPYDLNTTVALRVRENQSVGTKLGFVRAKDQDRGDILTYKLVNDKEKFGNEYFTMDENGTLYSAVSFDYERNQTFNIRVRVTDLGGLISRKNFTVSVINVVEDNDDDGTEDHYDPDDDNDGFSDFEELAYGSDPLDPNSVINQAPEDILLENGGVVLENRASGTLVARFAGVDPDKNDTLSYSIVDPKVKTNFPFKLFALGGLRTTRVLDYETDEHNYSLTIGVMDERNETFEKSFTINLLNVVEDMDGDGTEDAYDEDRDGDGFTNEDEVKQGTDPNDQYSHSNKPILQTGEGFLNEDGSIDLSGGVEHDGNGEITDFGFVLSSGISLDRKKSKVLWIRGVGEPESFKLKLTQSPYQPVLYIRAWAKNIAGYGIGPVRKVRIPEAPKPWWGVVQERASGWKTSDWFGNFISYEKGWLYHARLGWLYSSAASEGSVWLWKQNFGWLWTKEDAWPYLWSHQSGGWLYLYPGKVEETPRFYDYSSESYR
jgi:formylglycine-generating enzyme required for sulfatase activity